MEAHFHRNKICKGNHNNKLMEPNREYSEMSELMVAITRTSIRYKLLVVSFRVRSTYLGYILLGF